MSLLQKQSRQSRHVQETRQLRPVPSRRVPSRPSSPRSVPERQDVLSFPRNETASSFCSNSTLRRVQIRRHPSPLEKTAETVYRSKQQGTLARCNRDASSFSLYLKALSASSRRVKHVTLACSDRQGISQPTQQLDLLSCPRDQAPPSLSNAKSHRTVCTTSRFDRSGPQVFSTLPNNKSPCRVSVTRHRRCFWTKLSRVLSVWRSTRIPSERRVFGPSKREVFQAIYTSSSFVLSEREGTSRFSERRVSLTSLKTTSRFGPF